MDGTNPNLVNLLRKAESNIYKGINPVGSAIVLSWTLLHIIAAIMNRSFINPVFSGGVYYFALIILCLVFFKDIGRYLGFPGSNKKLPVFIGYKLDMIFTYPLLLMAIIGVISNLLEASGLFPSSPGPFGSPTGDNAAMALRFVFLPLAAYAEELLNLLLVSFFYMLFKPLRNFRLFTGILAAALVFGTLHSFSQGLVASVSIGIAYIPAFFTTLYTGSIWISFLAHLYNNIIALTKACYGSYHYGAVAVVSLIPALWALKSICRKLI